jgi:hypothetical protein
MNYKSLPARRPCAPPAGRPSPWRDGAAPAAHPAHTCQPKTKKQVTKRRWHETFGLCLIVEVSSFLGSLQKDSNNQATKKNDPRDD